jgi:hypothetical protein
MEVAKEYFKNNNIDYEDSNWDDYDLEIDTPLLTKSN